MCGRFTLRARLEDLAAEFELIRALEYEFKDYAPTSPVPIVRLKDGEREMVIMQWWLIPFWAKAKEPDWQYPTFNARVETVAEKPSYREPFKKRRCLVLSDGWYEWPIVGGTESNPIKQMTMMHLPDRRPFAMAGLWDHWQKGEDSLNSCTVIVRDSAPSLAHTHDRMPIVLPKRFHDAWLDPEFSGKEPLMKMLDEFDVSEFVTTPIGEPKAKRPPKKKKS